MTFPFPIQCPSSDPPSHSTVLHRAKRQNAKSKDANKNFRVAMQEKDKKKSTIQPGPPNEFAEDPFAPSIYPSIHNGRACVPIMYRHHSFSSRCPPCECVPSEGKFPINASIIQLR